MLTFDPFSLLLEIFEYEVLHLAHIYPEIIVNLASGKASLSLTHFNLNRIYQIN